MPPIARFPGTRSYERTIVQAIVTLLTVGEVRRDDERALLALTHSLQTLLPTFDDLAPANCRLHQQIIAQRAITILTRHREGRVAVVANARVVFSRIIHCLCDESHLESNLLPFEKSFPV